MNIRTIIFSGIIAALIGAMIGLAVARISQRESRAKAIIIGGASLGFIVGAVQESIRQQKDQIDEEDKELED
jgi:presenilin-like A22 family membrane protease